MPIDPLDKWQETLNSIPQTDIQPEGCLNYTKWYWERIQNIETDPTVLDSSAGFTFIFAFAAYASALASLPPIPDAAAGVAADAAAWESAMVLTVFPATLNVSAGAFVGGSPSNATTFSAITSVMLDPPSIVKAKAKFLDLLKETTAETPDESKKPKILLEATKLLTITVIGLDSTPSPAGPLPLTAAQVPLI